MEQPQWLGVIRHGQSTGNVIAQNAETDGSEAIDIPERDADVPLSETGREQAEAVGRWLTGRKPDERPEVVVVSPYLRTRQTVELALAPPASGRSSTSGCATGNRACWIC